MGHTMVSPAFRARTSAEQSSVLHFGEVRKCLVTDGERAFFFLFRFFLFPFSWSFDVCSHARTHPLTQLLFQSSPPFLSPNPIVSCFSLFLPTFLLTGARGRCIPLSGSSLLIVTVLLLIYIIAWVPRGRPSWRAPSARPGRR